MKYEYVEVRLLDLHCMRSLRKLRVKQGMKIFSQSATNLESHPFPNEILDLLLILLLVSKC
jgi:hypothetical protein